ncbi:MAG: hypothetical protein IJS61_03910 [Firmicutes bacterium]|nr:hypothetical protein [Bacillota bacterium]
MSFKKLKRRLSLLLATVMVANSNTFVVNAGETKYLGENKDVVTSGQAIADDVVSSQSLSVDVVEEKDFKIKFKVNINWCNVLTQYLQKNRDIIKIWRF